MDLDVMKNIQFQDYMARVSGVLHPPSQAVQNHHGGCCQSSVFAGCALATTVRRRCRPTRVWSFLRGASDDRFFFHFSRTAPLMALILLPLQNRWVTFATIFMCSFEEAAGL